MTESPTRPPRLSRQRERLDHLRGEANEWVERRRTDTPLVELAVNLYKRDRDTFASVLGSAIALRLFLFIAPTLLFIVQLVFLLTSRESSPVEDGLEEIGVTQSIAAQIEGALRQAPGRGWTILIASLWLMLWAGRSLTKVLAATSAGAWQVSSSQAKVTVRMAATTTVLVMALLLVSATLNRVRDQYGLAIGTTSLAGAAVAFGVAWFAVSLTLPKPSNDPGAVLPGAILIGGCLAAMQWFMQFYLPDKIARSSQVMGSLGVSVATLGYLFLVGRLMSGSLVLNAVLYEFYGSLSEFVFGLPGVRRLPRRYPRLRQFFDLAEGDDHPTSAPGGGSTVASSVKGDPP